MYSQNELNNFKTNMTMTTILKNRFLVFLNGFFNNTPKRLEFSNLDSTCVESYVIRQNKHGVINLDFEMKFESYETNVSLNLCTYTHKKSSEDIPMLSTYKTYIESSMPESGEEFLIDESVLNLFTSEYYHRYENKDRKTLSYVFIPDHVQDDHMLMTRF